MTNSLLSTAALLAVVLCGTPVLAQQDTEAVAPSSPPATAAAPSPQPDAATPEVHAATPGVRIVRLSEVNGDVQLDRQTGHGFEAAFANLPITQGGRLRTGDGVAEVEFEDNSSLRLTPNSLVEFPVLSLAPDGTRASTIHVVQGDIYVSLTKGKENNVNVTFGNHTLALGPASHIELGLSGKQPRLDVLDGTVQTTNGATTTTVGKKKALLFDPANSSAPTLLSKNEKGQYDAWDKHAVEYHQHLGPSNGNYAGIPYAYGLTDMNYYGSFESIGGCGTMWRPYLVSSNWSPYANGIWAWYPQAGYSWVSPYPWGWTAFHSGSWNYCAGSGWGWQPNNQWNGLQNTPLVKQPRGPARSLKPPIAMPRPVGPTMIAVNEKPLVASKLNQDTFVFHKDSAGLGVPRGTFGKLDHISAGVAQHGSVERAVFIPSSPGAQQENAGRTAANHETTATHTMPANGHSAPSSQSTPHSTMSSGSSSGGGHSMPSSGSLGGASGSMGGSAGASHGSSGGHH